MSDDAPEEDNVGQAAADGNAGDGADAGGETSNGGSSHVAAAAAKGGDDGDGSAPEDGEGQKRQQPEEDDDDDALARMMAFQEEEQLADDVGGGGPTGRQNDGGDGVIDDANLDPNVAFLGDAPGADDGEAGDEAAVHPNHNNPAAIALRQRQALQNAARLAGPDGNGWAANQPYPVRRIASLLRPSLRYTPLSLLAAGLLLHHTLRTRQQFYLAVVYLQSSKLAYILLGNAIIAMAVSTFTVLTRLFLDGGLRPNERDTIGENIRWDVTETCFALTIFRSELDVMTAIEFLGLVIMKCLHWSVELRGGHLRMTEEVFVYPDEDDEDDGDSTKKAWYKRVPHLRFAHVRYYALVQILLLLDILAVAHCALSVATHGPSVDILFGFEAAILLVSGLCSLASYHLHVVDGVMGFFHHLAEGEHHHVPVGGMAEADESEEQVGAANGEEQPAAGEGVAADGAQPQPEGGEGGEVQRPPPATRTRTCAKVLVERLANPWRDRRATLSFAIELQAQAAKFLFYVVFFAIVFTYYGMPINIFREVYVSFQQLRRRLVAFNTYRRLTHNMDKRFESIKDEEELDRLGRTCIICRDQMDLLGGCKKLPGCGHAFHAHCLREWLVQQQTCPTCRADIAANEARRKKRLERERVAAEREAAAAAAAAAGDAGEGGGEGAPSEAGGATATASAGAGASDTAAAGQAEASRTERGRSSGEAREQPRSEGTQRAMPVSTTPDDGKLPAGWTQHLDSGSGRTYYHNRELGESTWDRPKASVSSNVANAPKTPTGHQPSLSTTSAVPFRQPQPAVSSMAQFPCLYRVTFPSGAPVFSPNHSPLNPFGGANGMMMACPDPPQRIIPRGKLIVCTSIEYWPMPFQEAVLRMPDGYVRSRDVERFLMLRSSGEGDGVGVRRNAVEVTAN